MTFKLACADFTFPLLKHEHALDLVSMLGFDGVDIGLFTDRSHLQPEDVLKDITGSARDLSQKLSERSLELADVFLIPGDFEKLAVNHIDRQERQQSRYLFTKTLEFTHACGGRHMTILPGIEWDGESRQESFHRACDELQWRVEEAKSSGVSIGVEAHIGSIVPTPGEAIELIRNTPDLTLTLDYSHFTSEGISDAEVEPLIQYASHFHIRGACKGLVQASFSDNTIDYSRVLGVMREVGYGGYLGLEYVWIDWQQCNRCDNLSETILFANFLRTRSHGEVNV